MPYAQASHGRAMLERAVIFLATAASALVPSILLVWYFWARDLQPEPGRVLAATFGKPRDRTPIDEPPPPQWRAPAEPEEPKEPWRPDQHTETTWEKAMSVPWIDGGAAPTAGVMMVERPVRTSV